MLLPAPRTLLVEVERQLAMQRQDHERRVLHHAGDDAGIEHPYHGQLRGQPAQVELVYPGGGGE
ncbi:hypothetical protein Q3H58_000360 [Pseudomonas psychrotolerans]|nr:hypothetical protein [Pseudomonas psychrotolerans]